MAIDERSNDPTRGTGPEKVTQAADPGLEAGPYAGDSENPSTNAPDPARGGCMRFGWGCLPVLAGIALLLPAGLLF